jgi:HEAT repeat protein
MQKKLRSCGLWHAIQLIKLAGMMHLRYFEDDIVRLMNKCRGNLDMQYIGFLALSMMGSRDTIVRLCGEPGYTQLLSFRCLKEIFVEYTGDKRFLYSKLLRSDDAYIRRICVKGIGDEGFAEFDDELIPLLEEDDANLQCDVIRSLGQLRCGKAGEKIAGFTECGNWTLRNAAYQALAAIDGARYADLIESGLRDPEWWVRYNSAMELSAIEGPAALRLRRARQKDRFAIDILAFAIGEAELKAEEAALT